MRKDIKRKVINKNSLKINITYKYYLKMTNFLNNTQIVDNLLKTYDKVMHLKLFVDSDDESLKNLYTNAAINHNNKLVTQSNQIDAGFDLFTPNDLSFYGIRNNNKNPINKLDLNICCSAQIINDTNKIYNTGYYLYPRSSISKSKIRLSNATGIIDSGYRGHLMGFFDVINVHLNQSQDVPDFNLFKNDRYLQICAPGLLPIIVEIVNSKDELGSQTIRGEGGFGSTGR
jgi:dUTP pyrophosphatase